MTKPLILTILLSISATPIVAQETAQRTWATFGVAFTKSTAIDSGAPIVGLDVRLAYDLRHGLQIRGSGEYRNRSAIKRLLIGNDPVDVASEMRYGGVLVYHFRSEGRIRPLAGAGVSVIRHFLDFNQPPYPVGYFVYNSSVNPTINVGAGFGRNNEMMFTKYLADTYSYSNLRGWGIDYTNTRRISGRLHWQSGVKFKRWTFYQGTGHYDKRAFETSGFVGLHFR